MLLVIGARLGEMTTGGFTLFDIPNTSQTMVHVHAGAEELGHIYQPEQAINATSAAFVKALSSIKIKAEHITQWIEQVAAAHQSCLKWSASIHVDGDVQLSDIVKTVSANTDDDAIICNGAGNNTVWVHRFYPFLRYRTQLAPTSGTMGYGVPAAIAAKLQHPDKTVVAFAGDGCFMMNGQELATAKQYGANVIVIVINNGIYATIRMHQEREYPGRVIGTDMVNPDFCELAKAYGMHSELVTHTEEFEAAFERALTASTESAVLIEIRVDSNLLTPTSTIDSLRQQSR